MMSYTIHQEHYSKGLFLNLDFKDYPEIVTVKKFRQHLQNADCHHIDLKLKQADGRDQMPFLFQNEYVMYAINLRTSFTLC